MSVFCRGGLAFRDFGGWPDLPPGSAHRIIYDNRIADPCRCAWCSPITVLPLIVVLRSSPN